MIYGQQPKVKVLAPSTEGNIVLVSHLVLLQVGPEWPSPWVLDQPMGPSRKVHGK